MALFTHAQLKELAEVFNLTFVSSKAMLRVRDGFVFRDDRIWWRSNTGPQQVLAKDDWENIQEFPELYSHAEPKVDFMQAVYRD
jgi:hypothetical protein